MQLSIPLSGYLHLPDLLPYCETLYKLWQTLSYFEVALFGVISISAVFMGKTLYDSVVSSCVENCLVPLNQPSLRLEGYEKIMKWVPIYRRSLFPSEQQISQTQVSILLTQNRWRRCAELSEEGLNISHTINSDLIVLAVIACHFVGVVFKIFWQSIFGQKQPPRSP
jgi:hypothetical protein